MVEGSKCAYINFAKLLLGVKMWNDAVGVTVLGATSKPQGELQLCEAWTSTRVHESAKAGKNVWLKPQFHEKIEKWLQVYLH